MFLSKLDGYNEVIGQYYDSQGNPAELPKNPFDVGVSIPVGYSDFSDKPENWVNYSTPFIDGTITGFKDILCMRGIIKPIIASICGADYSNWDALSDEQKKIALTYFPTKIIGAQGFVFFATKSGGSLIAKSYLNSYQKISEPARWNEESGGRYGALSDYVYLNLGKDNGLQAERYAQNDSLDTSYIRRGVVFRAEDNLDGIGDWILSTNGYGATGLKARIESGEFTIKTGISIVEFCTTCIGIVDEGIY